MKIIFILLILLTAACVEKEVIQTSPAYEPSPSPTPEEFKWHNFVEPTPDEAPSMEH